MSDINNTNFINEAIAEYNAVVVNDGNVTPEDHIKAIAAEAEKFTIVGVNDGEGYKAVKSYYSKVKSVRTAIENKRKELKKVVLDYGRAIDGRAKELAEQVKPIEDTLKAKLDAVDDAIEQQRKAEQIRRHKLMIENGFEVSGSMYYAGVHHYTHDQINVADDEQLKEILQKGIDEKDRKQAELDRLKKETDAANKAKADADAAIKKAEQLQADADAKLQKAEQLSKDAAKVAEDAAKATQDQKQAPTLNGPAKTVDVPNQTVENASNQAMSRMDASNVDAPVRSADYKMGFLAAQKRLIIRMEHPDPITRRTLIDEVKQWRP